MKYNLNKEFKNYSLMFGLLLQPVCNQHYNLVDETLSLLIPKLEKNS